MADKEGEQAVEGAVAEEQVEGAEKTGAIEEAAKPEVRQPATAAEIAAAVAGAIRPQGLSPEQIESQWVALEEKTGFTRQQLVAQEDMRRDANLRDNLPLFEENGSNRAEKVLDGDDELLVKVKEMMAKHPPNVRANPQAWEDAAFLIKGKFGVSKKKEAAATGEERGKVLGGKEGKVTGQLSEGGRGGAGGRQTEKKKVYSELEQRIIDTTCGGDAEAYEKYRSKDSTKPREVKTEGSNRADLALQNLTRGARV